MKQHILQFWIEQSAIFGNWFGMGPACIEVMLHALAIARVSLESKVTKITSRCIATSHNWVYCVHMEHSAELPFEQVTPSGQWEQHWLLGDIHHAQQAVLRAEGIAVKALMQIPHTFSARHIPNESYYWVAPVRRLNPEGITLGGAVRFYVFPFGPDQPRWFATDVPVYSQIVDTFLPNKPFDNDDATIIADMLATLEFEQKYGSLPELGQDLATLPLFIP